MTSSRRYRLIARHLAGLLLFPLAGLAAAVAWLLVTVHLLGLGGDGFGNVAALVIMPIWAGAFGVVVWLPFWLLHARFRGAVSGPRALAAGALAGLLASLLLMGVGGFTTRGGATLMAYAVIAATALGGWAHNAVVRRGTPVEQENEEA